MKKPNRVSCLISNSPEVGTRENGLGILQRLNLVCTGFLSQIIVLKQEIALHVQISQSGSNEVQICISCCQCILGLIELGFDFSFGSCLCHDTLRVCSPRFL